MTDRHLKRCSMSLVTREIQIKTTARYYFPPMRTTVIFLKRKKSVGDDAEELEPLCTAGGNVKQLSQYGEQFGSSSKS